MFTHNTHSIGLHLHIRVFVRVRVRVRVQAVERVLVCWRGGLHAPLPAVEKHLLRSRDAE